MSINEHPPQDELTSQTAGQPQLHVPVLLEACLETLAPQLNESYLDLTAGYGGHAAAIFEYTKNYADAVLVDRDAFAIRHLAKFGEKGAQLLQTDFVSAAKQLIAEDRRFAVILVDLGVSSPQLDMGERGFSFTTSGPLDMRMDQSRPVTAGDIVNTYTESELVKLLTTYGEEQLAFARRIAQAIVRHRPFATTKELADVILHQHRGRWQKTHPATRTFQALRIAVNDELGQVQRLLPLLPNLLKPGGRVGIISFHSLEDRLVKRYLKEQHHAGFESELTMITKKAISGSTDVHNPRARSAQLRVAVKK